MGERRANEADFARRWAAGEWRGWLLRAEQGEQYRLIFQGRRGGPVGPDFRDAILQRADGERIRGDVELHLDPSGWYAHAHATDPRYNAVALHVTLCAGPRRVTAVPLASGQTAPQAAIERAISPQEEEARWPCERLSGQIDQVAVRRLFARRRMGAICASRRDF